MNPTQTVAVQSHHPLHPLLVIPALDYEEYRRDVA